MHKQSAVPDDIDTPCVVSYSISNINEEFSIDDNEDESNFGFFISTKRHLSHMQLSTKLHIDATYKLNRNCVPIFAIGITDLDKHFHCFGIALCKNEKNRIFYSFLTP